MSAPRYECECGWVGTEDEMVADSVVGDGEVDEIWSNWICPSCGEWADLEDYKEITDDLG